MMRSLFAGVAVAAFSYFAIGQAESAYAQQIARAPITNVTRAPAGPVIVAHTPDLQPIPSRIEHGVVSVRNAGTIASAPSIVTVNCHVPGQEGGCVDVPERLLAGYTDNAYPNRLVVNVPAIQPGHVYNHNLSFWNAINWPTGAYQFDFVVDASNTNGESNEGNNAGSHIWNVP